MTAFARTSTYVVTLAVAALLGLAASAGSAAAQTLPHSCEPFPLCLTLPDPTPTPPPDPADPGSPPPIPILPGTSLGHSMSGIFSISDGYGRDLHNYDLFANLPSVLTNVGPTIWLWLANMGFSVGKYALGFSVWFIEWSMSTKVVDWIKAPAQRLEQIWQADLIGGLKLRQLALLLATCYLGMLFVRGFTTRAWRETISTIAVNVLAIAVITHPVDFLVGDDGVLSLSRDLGADVTAVIMGQHPGGTGNPAAPIGQSLIDTLLITPWETLNYGGPITGNKNVDDGCQYSVKKVLDQGPWSDKDNSTKARELDHCPDDYGKYNEVADVDRALGAWLYALAMLLFAILTVCLNSIQILAGYFLLFDGLLLGLALIAAMVPAWQHQLAYRVSSIAATVARLLMAMFFVAVMTVLMRSLLVADLGPQVVRFAVIDLVVFSGFLFRKRLAANMQQMRAKVSNSLQRLGRRSTAPKALPQPVVPPGPGRIGRTMKAGATAFTESLAPAQQLKDKVLAAGKAGGKIGGKALAYTAGAPVSWPAAAKRAQTALTSKSAAAKSALGTKVGAAKQYASTYAGNLGKITGAAPALSLATRALGSRSPGSRSRGPAPSPAAARIATLTPTSNAMTPRATGTPHGPVDGGAPSPLPPGMLPTPSPLAQRLRERLDHARRS
ncbi:hypothetical protein [Amycolatopsis sp. NPDC059657]|uniref:hypothetical protein n=1 Tax=Amycolatopsis sp. NPDC059657 TaxID=3346899 RepID=UPI003670E868